MPDPALKEAIREAYASATDDLVLNTLEVRHSAFTQPIRVVSDTRDWTCRLEASAPYDPGAWVTFVAFAFEFAPPEVGPGATPEIEIAFDNVSRDFLYYVDLATQSSELIEVAYRPYLASDLSAPQLDPPLVLTVSSVQADVFRVVCKAGFGDISSRKFPGEYYTAERFPGLIA